MIHAIILAAGESSRMGAPKAMLDFDGANCLSLVEEACRSGGANGIITVLGSRAGEIVTGGETRVVLNENWKSGRSSSLKAGARALPPRTGGPKGPPEAEAFLLHPVDCPLAGPAVVRSLIEAYRARSGEKKIFVPSHNRRAGHPVLIDIALRGEILSLGDDEPARNVVSREKSRIEYVLTENPGVLLNMNTPEDYRKCLELYREMRRNGTGYFQDNRKAR